MASRLLVADRERGPVRRGARGGVANRPVSPFPAFVLPMPGPGRSRAGSGDRGERLGAVNGALPAAALCSEETARLGGGRADQIERSRLFEAGSIVPPPSPTGAVAAVVDRRCRRRRRPAACAGHIRGTAPCCRLFHAFGRAEPEQLGRVASHGSAETAEPLGRRIESGRIWL